MKFELTYLLCCSKNDDAIIFSFPGQMKTSKVGRKEASLFIKDFWLLRQNCLKTKKKSKASCIKEYSKVFFRENRMSITPTTEENMALQNMLTALI